MRFVLRRLIPLCTACAVIPTLHALPVVAGETTPPQENLSVWFAAPARSLPKARVPMAFE